MREVLHLIVREVAARLLALAREFDAAGDIEGGRCRSFTARSMIPARTPNARMTTVAPLRDDSRLTQS